MRSMLLLLALALVATACASTGASPRPYPGAPVPPRPDAVRVPSPPADTASSPSPAPSAVAPAAAPNPRAEAAVAVARTLLGAPYRSGGADPDGFDCSGFVQYVFSQAGASLPRNVREQWRAGVEVEPSAVRPGDLLFFATSGGEVSHVGIAVGEGLFVHAPSARGVVRIERWSTAYWGRRFAGARRIE